MSWTRVAEPYQPFETEASAFTSGQVRTPRFPVTIWEVTGDAPGGREIVDIEYRPELLQEKARLRIILAPLDEIEPGLAPGILGLCHALSIPAEFLTERLQGVCHSFGTRTDDKGFAAWFHYLCKAVKPGLTHTWYKSAFFLREDQDKNITLICFGPTPGVRTRLCQCIAAGSWRDVSTEPLALFDLILDGLFVEVDTTVWSLLHIISELERKLLAAPKADGLDHTGGKIKFDELHNRVKDLIELGEVIESCLLVVDGTLSQVGKSQPDRETSRNTAGGEVPIREQVKEILQYRRSLFTSTRLRLGSLQKRVDNTINLAFHLMTQQDSRLIRMDSASMSIISYITVLFLPTTCVATIVGSQLFTTDKSSVTASPLFLTLWWIAIPLTILAGGIAVLYRICIDRPGGKIRQGLMRTFGIY